MKKPSSAAVVVSPLERAEAIATAETAAATAALRKSCEHALVAGLAIAYLHYQTVVCSTANLRKGSEAIARDPAAGFCSALKRIGIPQRTAYRWMNAAGAVLHRRDYDLNLIPEPGTPEWNEWESDLRAASAGMSLRRLMLGMTKEGSDDHRYDELIDHAEQGNVSAEEILERLANGELTLVQAIRAFAGHEATAGKTRADPVYLTIDGSSGEPRGLFFKSITTLGNTFAQWAALDTPAKSAAREAWKALVANLPKELR
jgi:hypothetical protein